jgi:outer membrane protein TolC
MTKGIATTAVVGLLMVLAVLVFVAAAEPKPKGNAGDAAQVKTLQNERIDLLTRIVALTTAQYQRGVSDLNNVVAAQNELTAARLDSTGEPDKRVALLKEQLEAANRLLKATEARFAAGRVSDVDVYRARSLVLDVKIRLLREQKQP